METIPINCKNDTRIHIKTKWMNPFQNYPNSLILYEQYIIRSNLYNELNELQGKRYVVIVLIRMIFVMELF